MRVNHTIQIDKDLLLSALQTSCVGDRLEVGIYNGVNKCRKPHAYVLYYAPNSNTAYRVKVVSNI